MIKPIKLFRLERDGYATFGSLIIENKLICNTLELPWLNNIPFKSCVPIGCYKLAIRTKWKHSDDYGHTFELKGEGVKDRPGCLIHPANWPYQLHGCIAPGHAIGDLSGKRAIKDSRNAFFKVINAIKEIPFETIGGNVTNIPFVITDHS